MQRLETMPLGLSVWTAQWTFPTLADSLCYLSNLQGKEPEATLRVLYRLGDERLTERVVYPRP